MLDPLPRRAAHRIAQRRLSQQPGNRACHRNRIGGWHDQPGHLILDQLGNGPHLTPHHRASGGHRLGNGESERFAPDGRVDEQGRLGDQLVHVVTQSEEFDPVGDTLGSRERLESRPLPAITAALPAITADDQPFPRKSGLRECPDQDIHPLPGMSAATQMVWRPADEATRCRKRSTSTPLYTTRSRSGDTPKRA